MAKNRFNHDKPLTILLIEHNLADAELIKNTLLGHQPANRIVHLLDGQTAMDYLFRSGVYADPIQSPCPQIILLDLQLPKVDNLDGLEVLRTIKASADLRSIPVVVLTASEAEGDIASAYESRVNSYLVKPADTEEFERLLHAFSTYWLSWNLNPKSP
jgi:CheY-like chemotaxis protein